MADTANRVDPKAPAFPTGSKLGEMAVLNGGIDTRTYLAAMAMQGAMAQASSLSGSEGYYTKIAVQYADALISALNNAEQKGANP